MKKLHFEEINGEQLVDIRSQHDYQAGHIANALNLNPGNFKKYATYYIASDQPFVFVVGDTDQEELDELSSLAEELGFTQVDGYISIDDVPNEELQKTPVIPAEEFLNKEDDYILLDVRQPAEITRPAPTRNLMTLPFEDLITEHESLDKSKEIYTLCGSGNRSTAAASYLSSKGFNPTVIEGGMKAIQEITK